MAKHESEETRKVQILTAAIHCIAKYGYHATSVDLIAKESKLSKGAIYWYFKSKEEVVVALSKWRFEQNIIYIEALIARVGSFKELLDILVSNTAKYMKTAMHENRTIHEINGVAMQNPELESIITNQSLEMHKLFVAYLKKCIKSGELKSDVDPQDSALYMRCIIDGYSIHALRENKSLLLRSFHKSFDRFYREIAS